MYGTTFEDYMVLAMEIIIAADCKIDEKEIDGIMAMGKTIPRLQNIDFNKKISEAINFIISVGHEKAIQHFAKITDEKLKKICLILAIESAYLNNDVNDDEENIIAKLASVMNIDDEIFNQIIDVVTWKFE